MTHRHLLLGTALLGLMFGFANHARAQYQNYIRTEEPAVSVDLSVLGLPAAPETAAVPPVSYGAAEPAEAVMQEPLPAAAPATDVYVAPPQKAILKPSVSTLGVEERAATPAVAKQPYQAYLTTAAPFIATPPAKGRHYIPSPSAIDGMTAAQLAALHATPPRPRKKPVATKKKLKDGIVLAASVQVEGPDGKLTPLVSEPPPPWTPGAPAAPPAEIAPDPHAEMTPPPTPAAETVPRPSLVEVPLAAPAEEDVPPPAMIGEPEKRVDMALPETAPAPAGPQESIESIAPPTAEEMHQLGERMEETPELVAEAPPPPEEGEMPVVPSVADLTLGFNGNSSDLTAETQKKLDAVIRQLRDITGGRLQVRGYATGEDGSKSSARRIALSRVLSVRSYLMDKGVKPTRVDVRAMGSETDRSPLDRVDLVFAR
jgi:outer membrane protein OmpA-like peptidoglycan-associated protein